MSFYQTKVSKVWQQLAQMVNISEFPSGTILAIFLKCERDWGYPT